MKKALILLLSILLLLSGCGKKDIKNVKKEFNNQINGLSSYNLKGNMEIYTDQETFTYSIDASFLKDNFYKVKMVNQTNNHEQVILRNKDAVYVITPSLNKSFKFQSEWPNNSSQAYLLKSISDDITNDSESSLENTDNNYIIKSKVNYPNNTELSYQKTTLDSSYHIKKNEIYNKDNVLKMKVTFNSIDYHASLSEDDFKLEQYIKEESSTSNKCEGDSCEKTTGSLDNILYPLYIPSNTKLSSSDKLDTDHGKRAILTFAGDKNFVLVEEPAVMSSEFEIVPVYGDPLAINDTIGVMGANSLSWTKDNISYYLAGNDLTGEELLTIGESIGNNNQTVSAEK